MIVSNGIDGIPIESESFPIGIVLKVLVRYTMEFEKIFFFGVLVDLRNLIIVCFLIILLLFGLLLVCRSGCTVLLLSCEESDTGDVFNTLVHGLVLIITGEFNSPYPYNSGSSGPVY